MTIKSYTIPDQELQADHQFGGYELICQIRKTPTVLYGIFLEAVRTFYMQAANMPIILKDIAWNRDPKRSTIWIDTELRWESEHPEFRPAIYVALSPITYISLTGRDDGKLGNDLKTAETDYSRSGSGTVSFIHIGNTDAESCVLADATLDYMDAFSVVLRDDFCFTSLRVAQRIPLRARPKESRERWDSVVTMTYAFQDTWTLKLESQVLKEFTFNAGQGLVASGIVP